MNAKQELQQDVYEWINEVKKLADEGYALGDRVGALKISCPSTEVVDVVETNYLSQRLALDSEELYLDYTDPSNPVTRARCMKVGCDIDALYAAIDQTNIIEPAADVAAINAALVQASNSGGGIVRPVSTALMTIANDWIYMQDSTILDMSNVAMVDLTGNNFSRAVEAVEVENFAVNGLSVDGNTTNKYAVWSEDSRNYVIQNVSSVNMDNNSIDLGDISQNVTVRYCDLNPGRDEDGNSLTSRNQHGIVSSSESAPGPSVPSARFNMVYSTGHAYYSNKIVTTDGLAIDSHASNVESMGNYTWDCAFGHKYPHAQNIMVHHNQIGGHRSGDVNIFRLYTANDWDYGYGGDGDNLFVFENKFHDLTSGSNLRVDLGYGDSYFIKNDYDIGSDQPYFSTTTEENPDTTTQTANQDGNVYVFGDDEQLATTGPGVVVLTDPLLTACDHNEMIRLMNLPRDGDWFVNATSALPQIEAY